MKSRRIRASPSDRIGCSAAAALVAPRSGLAFSGAVARRDPHTPSRDRITVERQSPRRCRNRTFLFSRRHPTDGFDDAARDAALKALIATGLFDKVSIDRAAASGSSVHVTEAPVLDRVAFEGNKKSQGRRS